MATELTQEQKALMAAQEALRTGHHLMETVMTQLLSSYDAPQNSPIARALAEMKTAQEACSNALYKRIK